MDKKDTLVQSEEPLHIDISQMMVSKKSLEAAKRGPNGNKQHMEVEVQEMNQQLSHQNINQSSSGSA